MKSLWSSARQTARSKRVPLAVKSGAVVMAALWSVGSFAGTTTTSSTTVSTPQGTSTTNATVPSSSLPKLPISIVSESLGYGPQLIRPGSKMQPSGYSGSKNASADPQPGDLT